MDPAFQAKMNIQITVVWVLVETLAIEGLGKVTTLFIQPGKLKVASPQNID